MNHDTPYKVEKAVIVTVLDTLQPRHKQAIEVAVTKTESCRIARRSVMKRYPEPRYRIGRMVKRDVFVGVDGNVIVPDRQPN